MDGNNVHDALLHELRKRCAGPPEVAVVAAEKQKSLSLRTQLVMLLPLVKAVWRCAAVRAIAAVGMGCLLLARAGRQWLATGLTSSWATAAGCVLLLCGFSHKIPGGVPFLEVKTRAGFHCNEQKGAAARNSRIREAFRAWQRGLKQCPYLQSGELCTLLPFFWNGNRGGFMQYERIWVQEADGERSACDWVFPPSGHNPDEPVVILLTGLAPDIHWTKAGGFVADAAWHLCYRKGMTVVVLVARGTMDTQVKRELFHGARVTDLREAVLLAEGALGAVCGLAEKSSPVFAAGYSMGAIILANYCGVYGPDARIRGGVHFSGMYDAIENMNFEYSEKVWQAYLAYGLKSTFLTDHNVEEAVKRGIDIDFIRLQCQSIVDMDTAFVVKYNGFEDLQDYYRKMSLGFSDKWKNVAVPLLAITSRDDPITHGDSIKTEFAADNEHLLFLTTDIGGHVGWPLGWMPWTRGFDFMNEAIDVFVGSVLAEK